MFSSTPQITLGNVFEVSSGGTPNRKEASYWDNGTIPWVKISDMSSMYLSSTEEFITEKGLNNSSAKVFAPGTLLLSIFATLGSVSILKIAAATNQAIAGLRLKADGDSTFYFYALSALKERILSLGRGATQKNINLSILKQLKIPYPPKEEMVKFSLIAQQADKSKFI